MKGFSFLAVFLFSTSLSAAATQNLRCMARYNYTKVFDHTFSLSPMDKNILVGTIQEYRVYMTSLDDGRVELQAYDGAESSRSYSLALLTEVSPDLELILWKRESLMEVRCGLSL